MSKKLHSKLLSVILCIAICCAALCGSIIAVNAAVADFNGTYTITVGDEKQAVPFGANEVKAQVKFDLPAGFVGGQFTAVAQSTYTIGDTATAVAITTKDGSEFDLADVEVKTRTSDNNKIFRFVIGDGVLCTSITIEYTISLTGYVQESPGTKFPVSITLSEDDLVQFGTYDLQDVKFTASAESDAFFHAHSAWYDITSLSDVNGGAGGLKNVQLTDAKKYIPINIKDSKHTIASGTCTVCEGVNSSASYKKNVQVIPDYAEFDGKTTTKNTTGWCGISGVTVRYNDNGGLNVDVHVYSQYRSGTVDLLICDTEGNELYRLPCVADGTSYFAGNGFPAAEKVFTITGLSASNIDTELLLTLAEYGDSTNVWFSRTMPFCLADYCQNVVEENSTIWASGATEAQIEADKDVAAALYYYGKSIDESVFDKNTSAGSDTDYIAANYDEWDGTKVEPTETDDDGNIIINNAEELAWVALGCTPATTTGKTYKVVENSVFNLMGMDGITINSTAAQVSAATKTYQMRWIQDADSSTTYAFQGNFDGNGLIVYNASAGAGGGYGYSGLFPVVKQANNGDGVTIKNVKVMASYFVGYHCVGAIVGMINAPGTSCTGTFENLVAENCVLTDNNNSNAACQRTVGNLIGNVGHTKYTLNNCAAYNNTLSAVNIVGGFVANTSAYAGQCAVNNSIVIGSTPISQEVLTTDTHALNTPATNARLTNVHTADVDAAILGSNWFDTETYPELSIFHKLSKQYVDENTHKVICVLKAGDNTCDLKGLTEAHTLTKNAEGNAKVCECGYSVPVYKDIDYIAANYDEWDGTKVQPTTTDADGNVIINNAEELAWIALEGGAATNGVNYKVKANSVFNLMGMAGITINSTVADVQAAEKTWQMRWIQTADSSTAHAFGGNFDGNGLTVYNASAGAGGGQGYTGLFPVTRQSADGLTQEIKNVQVVASYFVGYHYAGALIGNANAPGTSCVTNISNVMVKNCYTTDNANTNAATNRTAATVVGNVGHNKTTLNNCIVINTTTVGTNIYGGFIGNSSAYSKGVAITNSVMIGNTTKPVDILADDKKLETPAANATLTNVHTADVAAATLGAEWFDTATYPELSIFHDMITVYVDANTHQNVCQHFINGTQCSTTGTAATHTMVDAEDGKSSECECGYSYEIKGIHAMGLPEKILNRITSNSIFAEKFATNALFKAAYNEDVFSTQVQPNVFDMYTTSLNLKVNPHIGFMFAFHGDYKTNRSNITVTFTVDGETYTTEAVETNGTLGTNWVNNSGAGRYHLYRFKELPVSKLCKDVKVTVNYNGVAYDFGTYSAAGYAINAMNAGEDYMYHVNASMALVYYSEMLAARASK